MPCVERSGTCTGGGVRAGIIVRWKGHGWANIAQNQVLMKKRSDPAKSNFSRKKDCCARKKFRLGLAYVKYPEVSHLH